MSPYQLTGSWIPKSDGNWVLADVESCRYCKRLAGHQRFYEFVKVTKVRNLSGEILYLFSKLLVNLNAYTKEDLDYFLREYGGFDGILSVEATYGRDADGIAAECIFESMAMGQSAIAGEFRNFEDAKNAVLSYIQKES